MLKVTNKRDIKITRGDSAYLELPLINTITKEPFVLDDNDVVRIHVRDKGKSDGTLLFSGDVTVSEDKSSLLWHIHPYDTQDAVEDKTYYWDGEVERVNGDNFTFVYVSEFTVLPEVTKVTQEGSG